MVGSWLADRRGPLTAGPLQRLLNLWSGQLSTYLCPHEFPESPDARHALGCDAREVCRLPELVEVVVLLGELEIAELRDQIGHVVVLLGVNSIALL